MALQSGVEKRRCAVEAGWCRSLHSLHSFSMLFDIANANMKLRRWTSDGTADQGEEEKVLWWCKVEA
ncbi:Hypothetical predicted protein, partial [Olea europaea subsp. europaea]